MKVLNLTVSDFISAQSLYYQKHAKSFAIFRLLIAAALTILAFFLIDRYFTNFKGLLLLFPGLFILALIIFYLALPVFNRQKSWERLYQNNKNLWQKVQISFDAKNFYWKAPEASSQSSWTTINRYLANDTTLLIFKTKDSFYIVPTRLFESSREKRQFFNFLKQSKTPPKNNSG